MPISLSQVAANTAKVTFPYAGDSVIVTYYPEHVTDQTLASLNAVTNLGDTAASVLAGLKSFNEMLVSLMASWDVYEDEGHTQMVPLTAERFAGLPFSLRNGVLQAIMGDFRPNPEAA